MRKIPISAASVAILVTAVIVGGVFIYLDSSDPYSSPQATIAAAVKAASSSDLPALHKAGSSGYYADVIGHFGQFKYEQVRSGYNAAFDRARPRWMEYRQRAQTAAETAFRKIHEHIDTLGREAVAKLSVEERLHLTEDRAKYADFVFDAGLKALTPDERQKIDDPAAFRAGRGLARFVAREGWTLLSPEDKQVLGSKAVLAPEMNREKVAFLAKIGTEMLSQEQKDAIAGITADELSAPQEFMLKHGEPLAASFFSHAAIESTPQILRCDFPAEEQRGSLWRGETAICGVALRVRGTTQVTSAFLRKDGLQWKLDALQPDFYEIAAAYPPKPARVAVVQLPGQPVFDDNQPPERLEQIHLSRANWSRHAVNLDVSWTGVFLGKARSAAVQPLLWVGFAVLFIVVMTFNFRRLKNETFEPEFLEGEQQLDELVLPGAWTRTITRLTNRRVLQVRLNWFLTTRRIHAIALDDIHSVAWRRYTNWFLIAAGIYFAGTLNPLALLLVMLGVEAKIHTVRFNTPFAQMLRTNAVVTSLHRKHFDELSAFYRKAQLYWAQTRTQKRLPVATSPAYQPEKDRDFLWGAPVWLYVGVWMTVALGLRIWAKHVTLDDLVAAPLLLGLTAGIALRGRRDALLAAVIGFAGFLTVKFPGSSNLFGLPVGFGSDGGAPYFEQYFGVLVALLAIAGAAAVVARFAPLSALFTPVLWLVLIGIVQPALLRDFALYGRCALAIGAAVVWSWLDAAIGQTQITAPPTPEIARPMAA